MEETVWNNFLTESEKQFTDLFEESKLNNVKNKVKKGINKVKSKFKSNNNKNTSTSKQNISTNKQNTSTSKKSGLDSLNTVTKNSTSKEKIKERFDKGVKKLREDESTVNINKHHN